MISKNGIRFLEGNGTAILDQKSAGAPTTLWLSLIANPDEPFAPILIKEEEEKRRKGAPNVISLDNMIHYYLSGETDLPSPSTAVDFIWLVDDIKLPNGGKINTLTHRLTVINSTSPSGKRVLEIDLSAISGEPQFSLKRAPRIQLIEE